MKNKITLSIAALLFSFSQANASPVTQNQFTFIGASYLRLDHSDVDIDPGLGLVFSYGFNNNWYVTGSRNSNEVTNDENMHFDYINWQLGIGRYWSMSANNTVYFQLSAETQKMEADLIALESHGASIEFGNRYQLNPQWTVLTHARFSDINVTKTQDRSNDFYFGAGLEYQYTEQLSMNIAAEIGDFDQLAFGFRYHF